MRGACCLQVAHCAEEPKGVYFDFGGQCFRCCVVIVRAVIQQSGSAWAEQGLDILQIHHHSTWLGSILIGFSPVDAHAFRIKDMYLLLVFIVQGKFLDVDSLPVGAFSFVVNVLAILLCDILRGDGVPLPYFVAPVCGDVMQLSFLGVYCTYSIMVASANVKKAT